jgi:ribosomal protein S28E/S33
MVSKPIFMCLHKSIELGVRQGTIDVTIKLGEIARDVVGPLQLGDVLRAKSVQRREVECESPAGR